MESALAFVLKHEKRPVIYSNQAILAISDNVALNFESLNKIVKPVAKGIKSDGKVEQCCLFCLARWF